MNLTRPRPVRILSDDVARKIAAGEVIDRPNAILRELLDNAVDSGAGYIVAEIDGGGIDRIRVSDNGSGMTKEDLSVCARPHATSKIITAEDLLNLSTLGFRGEALASIAAVSRLSIASGTFRMRSSISEDHIIEEIPPVQNGKGTIVTSEGLFENYPARRNFLKRPATENLMCREIFVEKALPRTDIHFRLITDSALRLDLPANVSFCERFVKAMEFKEPADLFVQLKGESEDWNFNLIIGEPSVFRNHRKHILIYVNGRKVNEYSLMQAVEYGCQGFFPNGSHPAAVLFANVNPSLVDFNIHPAKREVRFKDISTLHHGISSTVKNYFRSLGIKSFGKEINETFETGSFDFSEKKTAQLQEKNSFSKESVPSLQKTVSFQFNKSSSPLPKKEYNDLRSKFFNYEKSSPSSSSSPSLKTPAAISSLAKQALENDSFNDSFIEEKTSIKVEESGEDFNFIGTVLNCFIVVEKENTVYFIDQHAAHERINFDRLISSKPQVQNLLIPYEIQTENSRQEKYLEENLPILEKSGFYGKKEKNGLFVFDAVPSIWNGTQEDLAEALLNDYISSKDLMYRLSATTACRSAVMDGDSLDEKTAREIAQKALSLPDPHCPHGRPVWTTITKEQLFARVRRT